VLERVTATVRRHRMFDRGDLVVVSVSGGPDSLCLLYALWHLRRLFGIRLAVFHFDHRLRPDSGADAAYVRRVAERLRVPFHLRTAGGEPPKGASVEAWATARRWRAADDLRRELGGTAIAEGHTLDDQAETVLLNIVRGTGIEGAGGIEPGTNTGGNRTVVVQPLIDVERADVEAFCRALHLRPRRDPMNEDRRYLRAAIRHDVLPVLERVTGRGVSRSIARTADNLRAEQRELAIAMGRHLREVVRGDRGGEVIFDAEALLALTPAMASRVVRFAMYRVMSSDDAAPWTKDAIEAVIDLARGRPGRRRDLPGGRKARREKGYVHVVRPSPGDGEPASARGAP
jgi:tRNA(Ile)-lysidine synthetase-like protein